MRWSWCAAAWCRAAGISAWPGAWWPTRIGELVPFAQRLGVRLGIEALHPMFCADRCVIASLGEAVDLALGFPAEAVGVVVDTYHVWWDARLPAEIARAAGRIVSYQVCDWVLPLPADILLGRGHLGDGVIDFGPITAAVTAAGYDGYVEVEIFNADVWAAPADRTAAPCGSGSRPPSAIVRSFLIRSLRYLNGRTFSPFPAEAGHLRIHDVVFSCRGPILLLEWLS